MGPTLAMMLRKASSGKNIYAVSRFSVRSPNDSDKAVRTIPFRVVNSRE
jgi:hypothetical protein